MTQPTKLGDIKREWHLFDADSKVLGRFCSEIATILMGKSKSYFARHLDCGDYVVVINSKDIKVTGKKEKLKKYHRYSGYPGGLTLESLESVRKDKPEQIIIRAVKGMLPQNRLRDKMLKRLFVFKDSEHKYKDKFINKEKK